MNQTAHGNLLFEETFLRGTTPGEVDGRRVALPPTCAYFSDRSRPFQIDGSQRFRPIVAGVSVTDDGVDGISNGYDEMKWSELFSDGRCFTATQ